MELGALAALLVRVGRVAEATRAAHRLGGSLPDALERGIAAALPAHPVIARVLANELSVLWYALTGWFRRPLPVAAGVSVSAHEALAQWRAVLFAIGLLLASECLASHVLLTLWPPIAAWLATGTGLYALLWLLGDYQLLRLNPVRLTSSELRVELGLRGRVTIPLAAIASTRAFQSGRPSQGARLCVFGVPDVVLELHNEVAVLCGIRRELTRRVALRMGLLTRELTARVGAKDI